MSAFTTKELFQGIVTRLAAAVYQGTATGMFNLVKCPAVFDIANGFRYAANLPCALVLFDGQTPRENNPELVDTDVAIVVLTAGPPAVGVDQWDEGSLIGDMGLLDILTGVRQTMAYHDGDDDAYQVTWRQASAGFILARKDSPSRLIGVEMKFRCFHQDLTT